MICLTNDTPLTRVAELTDLIEKLFAKIYEEVDDPKPFAALEEEYSKIKNR